MDLFEVYKNRLRNVEVGDAEFLREQLHRDIVTLHDFLDGGYSARQRLGALWIDYGVLCDCISSTVRWIAQGVVLPEKPWMFFYQQPDRLFDAFYARIDRGYLPRALTEFFQGAIPQAQYLHVCVNWSGSLIRPDTDCHCRWSIRPLTSYTSEGAYGIQPRPNHRTHGMMIPNLPKILGVSEMVATLYLARVITHDIGHSLLPINRFDEEPLHDAAMMIAAGLWQWRPRALTDWERFVLDECTDLMFMFESAVRIQRFQKEPALTSTQRWYPRALRPIGDNRKMFTPENLRLLFRVPEGATLEGARLCVERVIDEERAKGFPSWQIRTKG